MDGERKCIGKFGPKTADKCDKAAIEDYPICGDYEIEWCVCEDEPDPVFHKTPLNPTFNTGCCGKSYFAKDTSDNQPFNFKPFTEFVVTYPAGCVFEIITNIGRMTVGPTDHGGEICSDEFCNDIQYIEIDGEPNCLPEIVVMVKHK